MAKADQVDEYDATKAPGVVLYTHILQKGYQAGSVLGVGPVVTLNAAYKAFRKQPIDALELIKTAGKTTLGVFGLVAVLGALRISQIDKEGLEDRAYRLHYNKGQNRTDVFAQVGAAVGLAAGAVAMRGAANASALHYLGCSSVGAAGGVLLHVLTRPAEE